MGVPPERRTERGGRRWRREEGASDQTFRPHAVPQKHQGVVPREVQGWRSPDGEEQGAPLCA